MRKLALLATCGSAILLWGCSSALKLSSTECQTTNWRQVGLADGAHGDYKARLTQYEQACVSHGVEADMQAYNSGFDKGLATYCVYRNGLELGRSGGEFNGACAKDEYLLFGSGWILGNTSYRLEQELEASSKKLSSAESKASSLESRIAQLELDIDNATSSDVANRLEQTKEELERVKDETEVQKLKLEEHYSLTRQKYDQTKKKIDATIKKLAPKQGGQAG